VNEKDFCGKTPLEWTVPISDTTNLLRKHSRKMGAELKAEGK